MRGTPYITTMILLGNIFLLFWHFEKDQKILDRPLTPYAIANGEIAFDRMNLSMKKRKDPHYSDNKVIISAPIVEKPFIKKNGKISDHTEYYVQRSIQDYFIKFCESEVSREELKAHLDTIHSLIKTVKIEVEIKDGEWDNCDEEPGSVQSRIGQYIVIHRIIS